MSVVLSILQWLFWIFLGLTIVIVVSLYIRGAFRKPVEYRVVNPPHPYDSRFLVTIAGITRSFLSTGTITDFWSHPDAIQQARLEAIQAAHHSIHFETFFMTPGRRANDFAAAIADRAAAGLEVKLVVDSYGTRTLPKRYWRGLQAAGVDIVFFNQFDWRAPANFAGRTHRKLLIIDGNYALIGGAGISDMWDGVEKDDDTQPWLDVEMRLEGQVINLLEGMFMHHFTYSGGTADLRKDIYKTCGGEQHPILVTLGDNPTYRSSPIKALKQNSIICARKRIWLSSPYFLPDRNSQRLLIEAKKMGADVKILTTSEKSDKKPVYYASYNEYGNLLRAGIEIYEYQPSMIHAKMMLIDDRFAATGSSNYDPRSLYHNDELDITSDEPTLVKNIEAVFQRGFAHSKQVIMSDWRDRSWWKYRLIGRLVSFVQWQL